MNIISPIRTSLLLPVAVDRHRILWSYAGTLTVSHLVALLAVFPWFFSVTGLVLAIAGLYVFGGLGITLCYHRLLTHRGLACPKWFEYSLAVLGMCAMQDTPARWVAVHRFHHEYADQRQDPHSPLVNFFWGHVGWMLVENRDLVRLGIYNRYSKDILRDPFYRRLERTRLYPIIVMASWVVYFLAGFGAGILSGTGLAGAVRLGASLLVWGVFVRAILVWHITWLVNSATHRWGYRTYDTNDDSRNNWVVAILTGGEGWHNNHHADPRSARHGHRKWEMDTIFGLIWVMEAIGLATHVVRPGKRLISVRSTKV
jgi:fatty-acid desaturase